MKKNIYRLIVALSLTCISASAQRILDVVSGPMDVPFDQIESAGFLYIAESNAATLQRYDGTTLMSFPYPVRIGRQLVYQMSPSQKMADFRSSLFLILQEEGGSVNHVYRFNGTTFSRINFPGSVLSSLVVYQDRLYAVIESGGTAKLYSYNGLTVSEVPGGSFAMPEHCVIRTGGNYLYIYGWGSSDTTYLIRFDGIVFRPIHDVPTHVDILQDVVAIPGSEKAYFDFRVYNSVYFYDGTTLTESFSQPGQRTPLVRWDDEVAFQADLLDPKLYICHDGSCREISPPTGSLLNDARTIALYRNQLYLSLRVGLADFVYSFDHTSFSEFFEFPENANSPALGVREGLLLMIPKPGTGDKAYEYTGSDFIEIRTPAEEWLHESKSSNACQHGWSISYYDEAVKERRWKFAVERPDPTCVPPPVGSATASVIPSRLSQYDRIEMAAGARNRGWCWNEIIVDWEISPVCPGIPNIPCIDRALSIEFTDKKGKVVLDKVFEKPFEFSVPLQDNQFYTLQLGVVEDGKRTNVLRYDNQLVRKGVEKISLDMYPKDDYFFLTVNTEKGVKLPLRVTLRDAKGNALWQQKFIAPVDQRIRAFVSTPGDYLEFSVGQEGPKGLSFYPNPVTGTLFIDSDEHISPIRINVRDLNGKIVVADREVAQGLNEVDLSGHKPGLYVLTITEGEETERQLIQLR